LQLYGVIANEKVLTWQPNKLPPANGTEIRLRVALYPSEKLNPGAGITNIQVSVPGPNPEIADFFNTKPINISHPYWQMLEQEIIQWLRLPNGLRVSPAIGDARIHHTKLYAIEEDLRPQPGRPPVDFAISDAVRKLDKVRSNLSRAERNHQPLEYILARIDKYQRNLEFLQRLHLLEQGVWGQLQGEVYTSDDQIDDLPLATELTPILDRTSYLPAISQPIPPEWSDIVPADFENPNLWAPVGDLKSKFKIASERSFWRSMSQLKAKGLRIIPARQDKRVRIFYRPEIDRIIAQPTATATTNISIANTIISNNPDQIWQAMRSLQQQQQALLDAINKTYPNYTGPDNQPAVPLQQTDKQDLIK
jgi:hypothetical protein